MLWVDGSGQLPIPKCLNTQLSLTFQTDFQPSSRPLRSVVAHRKDATRDYSIRWRAAAQQWISKVPLKHPFTLSNASCSKRPLEYVSVCVCVCSFHACECACACACVCARVCLHQTGNWQAADPLWAVFIFHSLPMSSQRLLLSLSLSFYISLLIPFSSQYLPGNNCDMNHFRQGGAQLWQQNSLLQKPEEEEKLYFDSHSANHWLIHRSSPHLCVYILSDFASNISIWDGKGKWDVLYRVKTWFFQGCDTEIR